MLTTQAFVLGIVQGLTEFMPVSSTAHLTLAGKLMRVAELDHPDKPENWTAVMAVIQVGTLLAALIYFLPDVTNIASGFAQANLALLTKREVGVDQMQWAHLGWLIIVGSVPIGVAGLLFRHAIGSRLTKNLWVIAGAIIAVAFLLAIAEATGSRTRSISDEGFADSIAIGISQICALVPGASRSGVTLAAGLLLGLGRDAAAKFSFLLMMPAVAASALLKLPAAIRSLNTGRTQLLAGVLGAALSGYLAIGLTLGYLQHHTVYIFVVYRIAIGGLVLALLLSGRIKTC